MGEHDLHRHVEISDNHGAVASADVTITQQTPGFRGEVAARTRLAGQTCDLPGAAAPLLVQ
jgi:hypothetical protein